MTDKQLKAAIENEIRAGTYDIDDTFDRIDSPEDSIPADQWNRVHDALIAEGMLRSNGDDSFELATRAAMRESERQDRLLRAARRQYDAP